VSGGFGGVASGFAASVSGGRFNTASGLSASVSGGSGIIQPDFRGWSAGGHFPGGGAGAFHSP